MSKLVYDAEHMTAIADKYDACVEVINKAIEHHKLAKAAVDDNYDGQAEAVLEEIFGKLESHMTLLKACCETTATYVRDSLKAIKEIEQNYSEG